MGGVPATRIPATVGDLAAFSVRAVADQQIRVVLRFAGRLDADRLLGALRLVIEAWPILGCRLVLGRRPRWEVGTRAPAGAVVQTSTPAAALADFCATTGDPRRDPVFDVRVVRTEADPHDASDIVCLRVDHVVADGIGAKELAYLLVELYRLLHAGVTEARMVRLRSLWSPRRRSYRSVLRAVSIPDAVRAAVLFPEHTARFRLPYRGAARRDPRFVTVRVGRERVERSRAFGRARGATLNDVLLTAAFRALPAARVADVTCAGGPLTARDLVSPARPVQMPVDLRARGASLARDLPPANVAGMTFPAVAVRPGEGFEATLGRVTAATAGAKSDVAAFHIPIAFTLLFGLAGTRLALAYVRRALRDGHAAGLCTPLFTNFGVLDPARLDPGGDARLEDAWVAPPFTYPPAFSIGVSQFAGVLTLSSGFCAAAIEPAAVDGLLRTIVEELPG